MMDVPTDPHDRPPAIRLPHEIKTSIVSLLNVQETKQVSLVDREWNAATEQHLWSCVQVPPRSIANDIHGEEEAISWYRFRRFLQRNPGRVRAIKEVTAMLATDAMDERHKVIELVAPHLTRWTDLYSCRPHKASTEPYCEWAERSHQSLAAQSMPLLESLTVHVHSTSIFTLPALLSMTPKLSNLHLNGYTEMLEPDRRPDPLPNLGNLTTLSVQNTAIGVFTSLFREITTSAPNISTFNFKMADVSRDDMEQLENYFGPLLISPRLKHLHLDFPNSTFGYHRWWYLALKHLYDSSESALRQLKSISVVTDVIVEDLPSHPSVETFRMTATTTQRRETGSLTSGAAHNTSYHHFAETPSRASTGLLSEDLLDSIDDMPFLVLIEACVSQFPHPFPPAELDDKPQSFHIQTFVIGNDTLTHCWMAAECSLFPLTENDNRDRLLSEIRGPYPSPQDDRRSTYKLDFLPPTNDTEVPIDSQLLRESANSEWYEFTEYDGDALPYILVEYIFSHTEHERFPSKGQRGLTLPPHIWDLLDEWSMEV